MNRLDLLAVQNVQGFCWNGDASGVEKIWWGWTLQFRLRLCGADVPTCHRVGRCVRRAFLDIQVALEKMVDGH